MTTYEISFIINLCLVLLIGMLTCDMRCDGTYDLNWKNQTRPECYLRRCSKFSFWTILLLEPVPLQYNFVFGRVLPVPMQCIFEHKLRVNGTGHARQPAGSGISFPFPVCEWARFSVGGVELPRPVGLAYPAGPALQYHHCYSTTVYGQILGIWNSTVTFCYSN